jgi:uncharacterized phage protein (TIGR01671 family)
MVREIRYRAWLKQEKKMGFVRELTFNKEKGLYHATIDDDKGVCIFYGFIEDIELMQFTGLKDVGGVEIYEGDILTVLDFFKDQVDCGAYTEHPENHLSEVVYSEEAGGFGVEMKESMEWYDKGFHSLWEVSTLDEEIKIIGNKFTDPELLK